MSSVLCSTNHSNLLCREIKIILFSSHGTNMNNDLNWNPGDLSLVHLGCELHSLPQGVCSIFYFQNRANQGLRQTWQKMNSWQISSQCLNLSTYCCSASKMLSFANVKMSGHVQDKHVKLTKLKCFVLDPSVLAQRWDQKQNFHKQKKAK